MAVLKLSALVTANNGIYAETQKFKNTFEAIAADMKANLTAIKDTLLADGGYATFNAAKADIPNHMTTSDAAVATQNFAKGAELLTALNAYKETDPIAARAAAIENIMLKVDEISTLVAPV